MIPLGDNLRAMLGLADPAELRKPRKRRRKAIDAKAEDFMPEPVKIKTAKVRANKVKPKHVERVEAEEAINGKSYEEKNWARLSPEFRAAHNRLRQLRGMSPIPDPKVDLYVRPRGPVAKPIDLNAPEIKAAARAFMQPISAMPRSEEGFTINGEPADMLERERALRRAGVPTRQRRAEGPSEGFKINGRPI